MQLAHPIVCVGIATLDLVHGIDAFPARPLKLRAQSFGTSLGGMAAVAACAIARLGGAAQFWGPVGDDAFGRSIRAELDDAGVHVAAVAPAVGASSSHSVVIVDRAGERLIVNHRGTALGCGADILPLERLHASALLADVRWPRGAQAMLDRANALGIPTVLDAEMGEDEALHALVPRARHVIFSEPGFAQWAQVDCESPHAPAALAALCTAGAALAAVTRGERGVLYATPDGVDTLPAFAIDAVETLGAGDVFHGAYALAIAEGMSLVAALRFASAAAAIRCTRVGGRSAIPPRHEVETLLAQ
ncbi:MAG TPA: PfkB family carbohydrate kinase [Casimicrobiaceae bacterium]|nr:PfkB family carbohydrate kinase [Casimicrobiaceae bacterium]